MCHATNIYLQENNSANFIHTYSVMLTRNQITFAVGMLSIGIKMNKQTCDIHDASYTALEISGCLNYYSNIIEQSLRNNLIAKFINKYNTA